MSSYIPYLNREGYADPTAHAALKAVQAEQDDADQRSKQLIRVLKMLIEQSDFDLLARIQLRDRKTGRVYR